MLAGATATWLQTRSRLPIIVVALALVAAELQLAWATQRAESLAGGGDYQFERVDLAAYYAPTSAAQFLQTRSQTEQFRYFGYAQHILGEPIPYTLRWAQSEGTTPSVSRQGSATRLKPSRTRRRGIRKVSQIRSGYLDLAAVGQMDRAHEGDH